MTESFRENNPIARGIEVKEGEPKIHEVYAYFVQYKLQPGVTRIDRIKGIYTDKKIAEKEIELEDLFDEKEDFLETLKVYERFEDLPDAVKRSVRERADDLEKNIANAESEILQNIYAIVPNLNSTDGNGYRFVWVLVTNPELATKIARGNGPAGSDALVEKIPLNVPIEGSTFDPVNLNLRRDSKHQLSDELYMSDRRN
ncbi:MAG: hypothetical protein AAB388_05090 [Patescibacteria group bacterium]